MTTMYRRRFVVVLSLMIALAGASFGSTVEGLGNADSDALAQAGIEREGDIPLPS